jgi:hypothetical protein
MDKYIRVKTIGEGSYGKALLVRAKSDQKMFVIKEINISKVSISTHSVAHSADEHQGTHRGPERGYRARANAAPQYCLLSRLF